MEQIVKIFQRKNEINTFEERVLWREELFYLIEKKKSSDILLQEIVDILVSPISKKDGDDLDKSLINKFNLFLKYRNKTKRVWQEGILSLIDLSEEYLSDKHKLSKSYNDYFSSSELSSWAEELYYLMGKLKNKDDFIQNILELLRKARVVLLKKDKLELEQYLRMFKIVKRRYVDFKK